jgi:hypothetical protein
MQGNQDDKLKRLLQNSINKPTQEPAIVTPKVLANGSPGLALKPWD